MSILFTFKINKNRLWNANRSVNVVTLFVIESPIFAIKYLLLLTSVYRVFIFRTLLWESRLFDKKIRKKKFEYFRFRSVVIPKKSDFF